MQDSNEGGEANPMALLFAGLGASSPHLTMAPRWHHLMLAEPVEMMVDTSHPQCSPPPPPPPRQGSQSEHSVAHSQSAGKLCGLVGVILPQECS